MEQSRKHRTKALAEKRVASLKKRGYSKASYRKLTKGYGSYPGTKRGGSNTRGKISFSKLLNTKLI